MTPLLRQAAAVLLATAVMHAHAAPRDITPAHDSQVIEILPERVSMSASTPPAAVQAARQWIKLARQNADPRYLGRAQAVLARWWGREDAPAGVAVLQATIEQSRHEFDAARRTLERALRREPAQAQGWLTLATLERVAGRYEAAAAACQQVARYGATLHAQACLLESRSLQGQHEQARRGLDALIRAAGDAPTRAWLLSLQAESEERAGRDDSAAAAYQASLALDADGYTALALADLWLRRSRPEAALAALNRQPPGDAVLLRRARAWQQLGDGRWHQLAAQLRERFAALDERGDDPGLHGRERALALLWLENKPRQAWPLAQGNLMLQKEPLDWWLALQSAQDGARAQDLAELVQALARAGLQDARLARWQPGGTK